MFLISILDGQQIKLMQYFFSTYVTGDIELTQYYSFLAIQHVLKPIFYNTKLLKYDHAQEFRWHKILN